MKKWLGRFVKLTFFLFAFFAIILTVLVNMGGDSETLKGAIEDYTTQATGFETHIDSFNKMTFFPYISVDAGNIRMKRIDQKAIQQWVDVQKLLTEEERGKVPLPMPFVDTDAVPDITIEKFVVSLGFWELATGSKKIHDFQLYNATLSPGSLLQQKLTIDALSIDETAQGDAFVNFKGELGSDDFTAEVDLQSHGEGSSKQYSLGDESNFKAEIGTIKLQGIMRPRNKSGFHLRDIQLSFNDAEVLDAVLSFVPTADKKMALNGEFAVLEHGSKGELGWILDFDAEAENFISGDLNAETIDEEDFVSGSRISQSWKEWDRLFQNKEMGSDITLPTDIHVKADTFIPVSGDEIVPYEGQLSIDKNAFVFQPSQ